MKVITLARKPLIGAMAENVRMQSAGGLSIDFSRIGVEVITAHSRGKNTAFPKRPTESSVEQSGRTQRQDQNLSGPRVGRWPSNLILQHLPECGCECITICAVEDLNCQGVAAGSHSAGCAIGPRASKSKFEGFGNFATEHVWRYGDTGGASRFFKQVKP